MHLLSYSKRLIIAPTLNVVIIANNTVFVEVNSL